MRTHDYVCNGDAFAIHAAICDERKLIILFLMKTNKMLNEAHSTTRVCLFITLEM